MVFLDASKLYLGHNNVRAELGCGTMAGSKLWSESAGPIIWAEVTLDQKARTLGLLCLTSNSIQTHLALGALFPNNTKKKLFYQNIFKPNLFTKVM